MEIQQDIAEVANPAGAEEFQLLLSELEETRNLLLAYRLLHFHEVIPDIKLNILGHVQGLQSHSNREGIEHENGEDDEVAGSYNASNPSSEDEVV